MTKDRNRRLKVNNETALALTGQQDRRRGTQIDERYNQKGSTSWQRNKHVWLIRPTQALRPPHDVDQPSNPLPNDRK